MTRKQAKPQGDLQVVGTRPPVYGLTDRVTGRAVFGADVRLPGLLYGWVVRSPHAHARILSIDTSRAEALPGVHAVITAEDLPCGPGWSADNTLASKKVLHEGHAVAAVAAVNPHLAQEAAALIEVVYEPLPAVVDVREAMQDDAPLLHENLHTRSLAGRSARPSNIARHFQMVKGDPERGFAEADVVVERTFHTATVHQNYIEPHASTAAWSESGRLTVWTTTQGGFTVRDHLVELLCLPMTSVRIVPTEIGGGFGGKGSSYVDAAAALLARKAGRPVKVTMTRAETLLGTGPTPGTWIRVKMGATRDGRLTAAEAELCYEAGAYPGSSVGSGANVIFASYDIPHGRIDGYDVVVNKPATGSYRAPGATPATFAVEQVVDELAERLEMDPIDLRLLNSAREGTRRIDGTRCGVIGSVEVLEAARAHPHYTAPLGGPNRARGVAHGYWGNWGGLSSCALSVNSDGTVALLTGSVDVSGSLTSITMQAAEALGLPMDRFTAKTGDTDSIGYADVTAGSRTTFATGLAAVAAAHDVLEQMRARAAMLWGADAGDVTYEGGVFGLRGNSQHLTFAELAERLGDTGGPVTGRGNVDGDRFGAGGVYGTHIVDLEVDPESGRVTILRYTAVQDVGRAVHPGNIEGQIQGGVTQGIGWALYEGYDYGADGILRNPTLLDYKLPTAMDVPHITPVIVEVPNPNHPYGVRGAGETPIVPPPAAIANAIYRLTGRRMERLPITPGYVLEQMGVI